MTRSIMELTVTLSLNDNQYKLHRVVVVRVILLIVVGKQPPQSA